VLIFSAAVRLSFVFVYGFDVTWTYHFFPSTVMFFIIGHLARLIGERFPIVKRSGVGLLALAMLFSIFGALTQQWDNWQFYASILLFALALPGIFEATKHSKWSERLGDLSYPMYLTHKLTLVVIYELLPFIGAAIGRADVFLPAGVISISATTAACIVVSIVTHQTIEKPVAHAIRWAIKMSPPSRAADPLVSPPLP
jgi:peptidoglycan/LPS O-acetylase OafA/YrhL